ncbi:MAG: hypothetical protein RSE41_00350 [Clostridia bacterium]
MCIILGCFIYFIIFALSIREIIYNRVNRTNRLIGGYYIAYVKRHKDLAEVNKANEYLKIIREELLSIKDNNKVILICAINPLYCRRTINRINALLSVAEDITEKL